MIQDSISKKYPVSTTEVGRMLGIIDVQNSIASDSGIKVSDLPVADLPMAEENSDKSSPHISSMEPIPDLEIKSVENQPSQPVYVKIVKATLPYVAIFIVGIFLYFFFFSAINFSSVFKLKPSAPATPKETALEQLIKQDLTAYNVWIKSYYYDVSDSKILAPEYDNSGNGLTNYEKFLLKLNPKSYDSLGLGMADSQVLALGLDPTSGKPLSDSKKELIAKYVDLEVASNRLTLYNLQNPGQVAGALVGIRGDAVTTEVLPNYGISDDNTVTQNLGIEVELNTTVAGRLEIPSLNINVPIIWTKEVNNFNKDLQAGVVHYPGTALPGQIGTAYISGHSSNYLWAKGDYNQIFSKLGDLADNTSFKITVVQKNGKDAIFHYVVTGRNEFSATDQEQFRNSGKSLVALSTCWPVGSTAKRLVVFGELTQTER